MIEKHCMMMPIFQSLLFVVAKTKYKRSSKTYTPINKSKLVDNDENVKIVHSKQTLIVFAIVYPALMFLFYML
jgi:hypothetical protein